MDSKKRLAELLSRYLEDSIIGTELDELRRLMDEPRDLLDEAPPCFAGRSAAAPPLNRLLFKETNELLKKGIDSLSRRTRQIFILSRIENKSHEEIAELFGISPGMVHSQLMQAQTSLRTYLYETKQKNKNFPGEYIYLLITAS
jgi:RNA polymerase sigma factor (sigma-70 family)